MNKVKRFEDLEIWRNSRILALDIYQLFQNKSSFNERALSHQIIRSSGSIMDNIAEGFERGGNKEFMQYLWVAKASAGETRSQLYRAFDVGMINEEQFCKFKAQVERISAGSYFLIRHLKQSERKGFKYDH